jgi:hypothetical protein
VGRRPLAGHRGADEAAVLAERDQVRLLDPLVVELAGQVAGLLGADVEREQAVDVREERRLERPLIDS